MELPVDQKVTTGKHDPGWNDPPTLSYNSGVSNVSKPRTSLNKRVAFPLSSQTNNPYSGPAILPPNVIPFVPTPAVAVFNPLPSPPNCTVTETACNYDGTLTLIQVMEIFNKIMDDSPELGSKLDDIKKRLNLMQTMWTEGKLVDSIQFKMSQLAKALENSDTKTADDIHKSLMVDHITSVGTWMVAVKKLIFHIFAKNDLMNIDKET